MATKLPGCFGYYPKPIPPNDCQNCGWAELCRKFVAKERLTSLMAAVEEAKAIAKGGK